MLFEWVVKANGRSWRTRLAVSAYIAVDHATRESGFSTRLGRSQCDGDGRLRGISGPCSGGILSVCSGPLHSISAGATLCNLRREMIEFKRLNHLGHGTPGRFRRATPIPNPPKPATCSVMKTKLATAWRSRNLCREDTYRANAAASRSNNHLVIKSEQPGKRSARRCSRSFSPGPMRRLNAAARTPRWCSRRGSTDDADRPS